MCTFLSRPSTIETTPDTEPILQTKYVVFALIAAASLAASPSFADNLSGEVGYVPPAPSASTSRLTRAEVQAEYRQAQRSGQLAPSGEGANIGYATAPSLRSRQEVRDELVQAMRDHQLPAHGEGADVGYSASESPRPSRAAAQAEPVRAQREGKGASGAV